MSISEARSLRVGEDVIAFNSRSTQRGVVTKIEPHHRQGYWITFIWKSASGKNRVTKKRHASVHLANDEPN